MLIQDFTYVDAPIAVVRNRLEAGAAGWLTVIAVGIRDDAGARVSVGTAPARGDLVVVPMTWRAGGRGGFAVLWADLEAGPAAWSEGVPSYSQLSRLRLRAM